MGRPEETLHQATKDNHTFGDARAAIAEMMNVALPAVVTMLSYTVMQFVDLVIVARLGSAEAMAAVGNGGIAAFLPAAAIFGIVGVVSTYVSQNLGAGTPERGSSYAWNGLWLVLGVWLFILLPFATVLPSVQAGMRDLLNLEIDPAVAELETVYARYLIVGMVFTIGARAMSHFFYGVHRPRMVMAAAITGNLVNIPVTWALVLGAWGLPELGVPGAAIGTIIGGFIEFTILFAAFLSPSFDRPFKTRRAWRISLSEIGDIWRIGWPAGLMFGNELFCWWVFMSGLIANFGVEHNTAGFITLRYMHLSFMPAVGLSMAVTAVVGKCIGMGRTDLAQRRAYLGLAMCMVYMGACALAMVVFREPAVRLFLEHGAGAHAPGQPGGFDPEQVDEIVRIGSVVLILAAAFQIFDAMAITIVGALRGAGDTIWPGVATAVLSWTFIIGMGWTLMILFPELGSIGPWIGAACFIIVLGSAVLWRFLGGKWKEIDLLKRPVSDTERAMREPPLAVDAGEGIVPELPLTDTATTERPPNT